MSETEDSSYKRLTTQWRTRVGYARSIALSRIAPASLMCGVLLAVLWTLFVYPPFDFNPPRVIRIPLGATISSQARDLKSAHAIRSETVFKATALILGGERGLIAGDYYFPSAQNVFVMASRMVSGQYELTPVRVTLPEGATIDEMALILGEKLQFFDPQAFRALAAGKEGYLFPDTYYFLPSEDPEVVLYALEQNFYKKIEPLQQDIEASGHSLHDVVTMASLLEEEARTTQSRKIIAGILWKRIAIGMRLQVDAVFPYILGKNTFEVTKEDLQTNSPYNTYLYPGLPLGPISNPGLDSLIAALTPTKSSYLYYLSDHDGNMHYSRTYEQHLRYARTYLGQ